MAKFDAGSISDIEYDFSGFMDKDTGEPIVDSGTVPEPSTVAVNQMMKAVNKAFKDLGLSDDEDEDDEIETPEDIAVKMNKIDDDDTFLKMSEHLVTAIAELCDGHPSLETLKRLRHRPLMGFFGYITGEVMSPEVSRSGTKNSQKRLRSV